MINCNNQRTKDLVAPKVVDTLQPITLKQEELSGEIGRRIIDLTYKNYMALDLDHHFIEPFQSRPFTKPLHYAGVVVDADSLGEPEPDSSIRPDGRKVTVKARVDAAAAWGKGAPHETLTFTEFVDPTGIVTYFHVLDLRKAAEDELVADCFAQGNG